MHIWDCINCSGFGVTDQRRYFCHISISNHKPIQYHWGECFPHYSANIISVGNQTKWESSRKICHSLTVLHITFNFSFIIHNFLFCLLFLLIYRHPGHWRSGYHMNRLENSQGHRASSINSKFVYYFKIVSPKIAELIPIKDCQLNCLHYFCCIMSSDGTRGAICPPPPNEKSFFYYHHPPPPQKKKRSCPRLALPTPNSNILVPPLILSIVACQ